MSGDVHVRFCESRGVRFPPATHLIVGFQHVDDARQFLRDLRERFAKFNLELHPDKTRLIEFGRFAARNRAERGDGKPETFDFLVSRILRIPAISYTQSGVFVHAFGGRVAADAELWLTPDGHLLGGVRVGSLAAGHGSAQRCWAA
jgi:hypothetical protein